MTTWADATKNSASFSFQAKAGSGGGTISQGMKFMGHIMQYSDDVVIAGGATIWTDATKN